MDVIQVRDDATYHAAADRLTRMTAPERSEGQVSEKTDAARAIVEAVRERGDKAVAEFTAQFDGVPLTPDRFELSKSEIDEAVERVEPALFAALERAHENVRKFHATHVRQSWEDASDDGALLGQRVTPLERVGVYVPGGKAFYPSSVLMNIAPARVAGVNEIIMVSPPSWQGSIAPVVLAAARIAGATRVFRIGGAQAVAALAYGTEHVPAVLKITGPGNAYVTAAKRLVAHRCAIDMEAGPSEVVVLADEKADPALAAAEILAQAEHDEDACAILITTSQAVAEKALANIEETLPALPRTAIARVALADNAIAVVVRNLEEAARLADLVAPEHLAIHTEFPRKVFNMVHNAGAVMLGALTPVAVGDYYAGPNHVLPTGRRARFASPLTADDFVKVTNIVCYSRERLKKDEEDIVRLATAEQLTAHARSVELRP